MFKIPPKETFLRNADAYDHQAHFYKEAMKHCKSKRIAVDVGAHIGLFSSKMVKDFEYVHAFEPMFYDYVLDNVPDTNLTVHKLGLSNEKITHNFNIRQHHTGMSKVDKNGIYSIDCIDLDSMNLTNVDLIKIDVESHEYFVIEGMRKFLKNNSPVIIIELNDKVYRENNISTLKSFGYKEVFRENTDYIFKKRN